MMRQYELVERVLAYQDDADEALLDKAYVYAMKAHGNQTRASGDPYFSHPLEVAAILTDLKLDDATIVAALLHDTVEDTEATLDEIERQFGSEIVGLVDGLTKIKRLDLVTKRAEQAENFRKLLLAISTDVRVLLVKLADRLHNMRTLEHVPAHKRKRISEETLEIYAPLAGRMGIQWMRDELEDLAFRWLYPDAHATVIAKLKELRQEKGELIAEIETVLAGKLEENGVDAEIYGREKKPYSIWRKMQRKQISLEQLSDIYAFRIIVDSVAACYRVLGIVHSNWRAVPGRFKDYISTPKQNDYQSIHTTFIGPGHHRVELQVRTHEMHQVAEYGVAAHAAYKEKGGDGTRGDRAEGNAYHWLRHLVGTLLEGDNPEEFLEHTKLELFQDQVFCFTPKGRLIALPRGACPIDFAYAVHTDVGNSCVGAKVNGHNVPLVTQLRNGDEVEIMCSKAQTPPAAWEQIAVTGKARSAIRRATREAVQRQYCALGRQILSAKLASVGEDYKEGDIRASLHRFSQTAVDEVLQAVGRGELRARDVLKAIYPDRAGEIEETAQASQLHRRRRNRHESADDEGWFNLRKVIGFKFRIPGQATSQADGRDQAIPIRGLRKDLPVSFGEGGAVPGDRIVGILREGKGIEIYPIHSPRLAEFDTPLDHWLDVTWDIDDEHRERFPAMIEVTALNEPGSLAQIAKVIGEADGNIDSLTMAHRAADFTKMEVDLEVWDLTHLNAIIAGLKSQPSVGKVERVFR